jgi:hypothetical protein
MFRTKKRPMGESILGFAEHDVEAHRLTNIEMVWLAFA